MRSLEDSPELTPDASSLRASARLAQSIVGIVAIVNNYCSDEALDRWEDEALQTGAVTGGASVSWPKWTAGHRGLAHAQRFVQFERAGPPGSRSCGNDLETPLLGIERHCETQRRRRLADALTPALCGGIPALRVDDQLRAQRMQHPANGRNRRPSGGPRSAATAGPPVATVGSQAAASGRRQPRPSQSPRPDHCAKRHAKPVVRGDRGSTRGSGSDPPSRRPLCLGAAARADP